MHHAREEGIGVCEKAAVEAEGVDSVQDNHWPELAQKIALVDSVIDKKSGVSALRSPESAAVEDIGRI